MSNAPLPEGYIAQWDPIQKAYYYVDTRTGISTWTDPRLHTAPYIQPGIGGLHQQAPGYGQPQYGKQPNDGRNGNLGYAFPPPYGNQQPYPYQAPYPGQPYSNQVPYSNQPVPYQTPYAGQPNPNSYGQTSYNQAGSSSHNFFNGGKVSNQLAMGALAAGAGVVGASILGKKFKHKKHKLHGYGHHHSSSSSSSSSSD